MYFTERLQEAFHMIFTSYDKTIAQEGFQKLESIINTLSSTNHSIPAMPSISTTDTMQSISRPTLLKEGSLEVPNNDGDIISIPGRSYLFETYFNNQVSLNYWLQKQHKP